MIRQAKITLVFSLIIVIKLFCQVPTCAIESDEKPFERGDVNADGEINLEDSISILGFLFLGNREIGCLDSADTNDSGLVNVTDAIFLLHYSFLEGPPPAKPFGNCGADPTPLDGVSCLRHAWCESRKVNPEAYDRLEQDGGVLIWITFLAYYDEVTRVSESIIEELGEHFTISSDPGSDIGAMSLGAPVVPCIHMWVRSKEVLDYLETMDAVNRVGVPAEVVEDYFGEEGTGEE